MHGAHPRAAEAARLRRRDRHRRLPPAGDPQLLRRRRVAGAPDRVLGRGVAARHRRLGAARLREARRHGARDLRRRPVRHRPRQTRRLSPRARGGRHDRAQVGRQPTRVRHRRHRHGRPGRALPRKALLGPGLLRHDQHRHLRARAGGAQARADRPPLRLLEGALPAPARDGKAALRDGLRRLLAGHRQPRPVPAGELRRARRPARTRHPGHPPARKHLDRRGRRDRRPRGRRGACVRRQLLPDLPAGVDRPLLRALGERDASRAGAHGPLGDRREHAHRPQRTRRRRDPRTGLRRALARPDPGGRGGRRRGRPRRPERGDARSADLPVQGGRVRGAHPREPDLGVACHLRAVRQGRRVRPDQRRPHPGGRRAARGRARNRPEAGRPGRREPGVAARVPDGQARDDHRSELGRRRRRRPARAPVSGQPAPAEDTRLRRGLPRRGQPDRSGDDPDQVLRAARDPDDDGAGEGGRKALQPP